MERVLKFEKIKTKMAAQALLRKTSILEEISKEKYSFEFWRGNVHETVLQVFFVLSTWPVPPRGIDGTLLPHAANDNSENETLFAWNCGLYRSADQLHSCASGDLATEVELNFLRRKNP